MSAPGLSGRRDAADRPARLLPPGRDLPLAAPRWTRLDDLASHLGDGLLHLCPVRTVGGSVRTWHADRASARAATAGGEDGEPRGIVVLVRGGRIVDAFDQAVDGEAGGRGDVAGMPDASTASDDLEVGPGHAVVMAQRLLDAGFGVVHARRLPASWVEPLAAHWRLPVVVEGLRLSPGRLEWLLAEAVVARSTLVIDAALEAHPGASNPRPSRVVVIVVGGGVALAYTALAVHPLPVVLEWTAGAAVRATLRLATARAPASGVASAACRVAAAVLEELGEYGRDAAARVRSATSAAALAHSVRTLQALAPHPLLGGQTARLSARLAPGSGWFTGRP